MPTTTHRRRRGRRAAGALLTAAVLTASAAVLTPGVAAAADAPDCDLLDDAVHQVVKPSNEASLLTAWQREIDGSARRAGFTEDQGAVFKASTVPGPGLVPVRRMYRDDPQDYIATRSTTELVSAARRYGYRDQGVRFYVSQVGSDCLQPVSRYRKDGLHRLAQSDADRAALERAGWVWENIAFYAVPTDGSTRPSEPGPTEPEPEPEPQPPAQGGGGDFTLAVVPDTQMEVLSDGDPRIANRNAWLARQSDVAFVAQTGDLVNWDTDDHRQMAMAERGMNVLEDAGIPYSVSVGNHDTLATGPGGSARDPRNSYRLQRDTTTLNSYFRASDFGAVAGAYEPGKVDNVYSTFSAGGLRWMVLSLEFCARPGAVEWAKRVVAAHPDHNVLVSTHSYLTATGEIDRSNQGYGDTSGAELFDELISRYPNIKMVFSGHVGLARKARVDTGRQGNRIYSFLTTMHDPWTNPVRMLDIDPDARTIRSQIYAPLTGTSWGSLNETIRDVDFVR